MTKVPLHQSNLLSNLRSPWISIKLQRGWYECLAHWPTEKRWHHDLACLHLKKRKKGNYLYKHPIDILFIVLYLCLETAKWFFFYPPDIVFTCTSTILDISPPHHHHRRRCRRQMPPPYLYLYIWQDTKRERYMYIPDGEQSRVIKYHWVEHPWSLTIKMKVTTMTLASPVRSAAVGISLFRPWVLSCLEGVHDFLQ